MKDTAIVLLSGGLDSATVLYWARRKWNCRGLFFDYGQRHRREIRHARALARRTRIPLEVVKIRLPWGGSSLLGQGKIPRHRLSEVGKGPLPSTYVPGRNTIFLAYALSWADAVGARHITIGANALDYSGYPDCRPGFIRAMEAVGKKGTRLGAEKKRPPKIWAPLLRQSKTQIVKRGLALGVPYELTWSCYEGGKRPCGKCDSCLLRAEGFRRADAADPALK